MLQVVLQGRGMVMHAAITDACMPHFIHVFTASDWYHPPTCRNHPHAQLFLTAICTACPLWVWMCAGSSTQLQPMVLPTLQCSDWATLITGSSASSARRQSSCITPAQTHTEGRGGGCICLWQTKLCCVVYPCVCKAIHLSVGHNLSGAAHSCSCTNHGCL